MAAASTLIAEQPDLAELDVNPFILVPDGGSAADLLVRLV